MRKMRILERFGVNVNKLTLLWMAYTYKMVFSFKGINYVFLKVLYGNRLLGSCMAEVWVVIWGEIRQ